MVSENPASCSARNSCGGPWEEAHGARPRRSCSPPDLDGLPELIGPGGFHRKPLDLPTPIERVARRRAIQVQEVHAHLLRPSCVLSSSATTRQPLVSLSNRCTIPGRATPPLRGHSDAVVLLGFSPAGQRLVYGGGSGSTWARKQMAPPQPGGRDRASWPCPCTISSRRPGVASGPRDLVRGPGWQGGPSCLPKPIALPVENVPRLSSGLFRA